MTPQQEAHPWQRQLHEPHEEQRPDERAKVDIKASFSFGHVGQCKQP